jgi:hypothetical protein
VPEVTTLRRVLAAIFFFGSIGTGLELVLLEHMEDVWQNVPLALIGIGCLALAVLAIRPGIASLRGFQLTMWLFIASGVAGVFLHYQGNVAFELELNPDAAGWELFRESLKGATPSLAPGTMTLLGALGLAYAYRHPAQRETREPRG